MRSMRGMFVALLGATLLVIGSGTASADPAVPTNWVADVTGVDPPTSAIDVHVVGGDAFLELTVDRGHTAQVLAPEGGEGQLQPFLRVERDGNVFANVTSPTYHRSLDRYGQTPLPEDAAVDAPPRWELIGRGGTHAWHDHRIHRTDPDAQPPGPGDRAQVVDRWQVPLLVDGEPVTVQGQLRWLPTARWWPSLLVAVALAVGVVAARRRFRWTASAVAALMAGTMAVIVAAAELAAVRDAAGGSPLGVLMTGTAALVAVVAVVIHGRHPDEAEPLALLSGGIAVAFAATRLAGSWMPFVPSDLPAAVVRYLVAATLGLGAGVVVAYLSSSTQRSGTAAVS